MLSYEDQEYHRRRSEIELERAVSAEDQGSAVAHLQLARMHRARRQLLNTQSLAGIRGTSVFRTDKEA